MAFASLVDTTAIVVWSSGECMVANSYPAKLPFSTDKPAGLHET